MAELILRGSEYQSFLNCRKQWLYQWVMNLEPKRPDNKLFFGTLFHKWLERYYVNNCNKLQADLETSVWFNKQDTSGMEQTDINDLKTLFTGVSEYYHQTYGESDKKWTILGTEVEFLVKVQDDVLYTGTIDLIYEVDGKVRFADHKTVASLTMYEEKSKMDRQISRYWWALQMISEGVGRIKGKVIEDGEEKDIWVKWTDLEGKEIDGFDYNLIGKDFPREPKQLKPKKGETIGALSQDKSQKTTYKKYRDKLQELGLDEYPYEEFLAMLISKPDPFLKRVNVRRNQKELESAMWEFLYTSNDIHDVNLFIHQHPEKMEEVTYRNIGTHCTNMCVFKNICEAVIEDNNVNMVMKLGYKQREEKK